MTTFSGLTLPRAGWVLTPMPQPHCHPDTPPPPHTVHDSRGLLPSTALSAKLTEAQSWCTLC